MDAAVDVQALMQEMGARAREAPPPTLAYAPAAQKDAALRRRGGRDLGGTARRSSRPTPPTWRPRAAKGLGPRCSTGWRSTRRGSRGWPTDSRAIAAQDDPVGAVNGGVGPAPRGCTSAGCGRRSASIGVIFESRPNVTADAGGLCLKAGNAAILRGGSESLRSAQRDPCRAGGRAPRGGAAGDRDPAGAGDRPGRGRRDAGDDRLHRRPGAARRQGAGRPGAGRGAGAGLRAPRGDRATSTSTRPPTSRRRGR